MDKRKNQRKKNPLAEESIFYLKLALKNAKKKTKKRKKYPFG
jgi:hypothetical protein